MNITPNPPPQPRRADETDTCQCGHLYADHVYVKRDDDEIPTGRWMCSRCDCRIVESLEIPPRLP